MFDKRFRVVNNVFVVSNGFDGLLAQLVDFLPGYGRLDPGDRVKLVVELDGDCGRRRVRACGCVGRHYAQSLLVVVVGIFGIKNFAEILASRFVRKNPKRALNFYFNVNANACNN